jgi:uncharacterized protein YjbI with pentapeptide repeats
MTTAIAALVGYFFGARARSIGNDTHKDRGALDLAFAEGLNQSVAQLASEEEIIRVGGIYSLEVWSEQSPDTAAIVADTLVSFIRTNASKGKEPTDRKLKRPESPRKPRLDIQAAMRVLGRLPKAARELAPRYDLSDLDLRGLELRSTNFDRANLDNSWLIGADLSGASLGGADLTGADLTRVKGIGANFNRAVLERAVLQEAVLAESDFTGALMQQANLTDVFARSARFRGALLSGCKFSNADLVGTDFSKAFLAGADLAGANLEGAILKGAFVRAARFDGAILDNADVSDIEDPDDVLAHVRRQDESRRRSSGPIVRG